MNVADVTYKEVMQFWNLSKDQAVYRLKVIRNSLEKKRRHKLTVVQFCKWEDVSEEEFYKQLSKQHDVKRNG